jgi:hypothetical protein
MVESEAGDSLVVLKQNFDQSAAGALAERGRPVRVAWKEADASVLGTNQEEEVNR